MLDDMMQHNHIKGFFGKGQRLSLSRIERTEVDAELGGKGRNLLMLAGLGVLQVVDGGTLKAQTLQNGRFVASSTAEIQYGTPGRGGGGGFR